MTTAFSPDDRAHTPALHAEEITIGYDQRVISEQLTVDIPRNSFTAIVGPNACGKSTLLRAFARVLKPTAGHILLEGEAIQSLPTKQVARRMGLLPQTSYAPDGIRVGDLVARGRTPHQSFIQQWRESDEKAVREALNATRLTDLSDRLVDELSGGQRQRVWVAMLLAQQTQIMLLDEPTTFLDITHQYELLRLLQSLHRGGKTVVTVLHDLNQAARYATHVVVMKAGKVVASGPPAQSITAELVEEVFKLPSLVIDDPITGTPMVVPRELRSAEGAE